MLNPTSWPIGATVATLVSTIKSPIGDATYELQTPVMTAPVFDARPIVTGSLRDAILAANAIVRSTPGGNQAQGVWQVREGAYRIMPLAGETSHGLTPLVYETTDGAMPTLARRTNEDGAPEIAAIVGSRTYASFAAGTTAPLQSLAGLTA
jgi:hypothetical protein